MELRCKFGFSCTSITHSSYKGPPAYCQMSGTQPNNKLHCAHGITKQEAFKAPPCTESVESDSDISQHEENRESLGCQGDNMHVEQDQVIVAVEIRRPQDPDSRWQGIHTLSPRTPGSTHGFPCLEPKEWEPQNETLNCVSWRDLDA